MNEQPFFSIITVCYNSEKTIERTIRSVANQTCRDYEYIVIDGKSNDDTNEIIRKVLPIVNAETKYISEKDNGIYDAMNKGIRMSHGRFICFMNSDDWFEDDALEKVKANYYDFCDKNKNDNKKIVLYGGQKTITNGMEENCVFYHHQFLKQNMICHQACFTSRECFDEYGFFNEQYASAADYDFTLRMFLSEKVIFIPIHEFLVNFSSGGMNESFIGRFESNIIRFKNGVISKKAFRLETMKLKASQFIYFLLRKKPKKVVMD